MFSAKEISELRPRFSPNGGDLFEAMNACRHAAQLLIQSTADPISFLCAARATSPSIDDAAALFNTATEWTNFAGRVATAGKGTAAITANERKDAAEICAAAFERIIEIENIKPRLESTALNGDAQLFERRQSLEKMGVPRFIVDAAVPAEIDKESIRAELEANRLEQKALSEFLKTLNAQALPCGFDATLAKHRAKKATA